MLPLYVTTMFLSALLLFWVQPMFTKTVLPLLGGSPAVWNTAMVFFQAALLAGYYYVHVSTRVVGLRAQALVHMAVLAVAFVVLPIGVPEGWVPPASRMPTLWIIGLFAVALGLPFFAVSATAPLLQRWFAHTGHPSAADPYFLYGASNLGSIIALLAYPVVLEPFLKLGQQTWAWMFGYALLVVLIGSCAFQARRNDVTSGPSAAAAEAGPEEQITWQRRLHWMVLAFAPSSLLLGVTTFLTTDVAAVPLLWIIPLVLYLLTFVIVFARKPILKHDWMVRAQALLIIPLSIVFYWGGVVLWLLFPLHLVTFFATAMVCHGELARRRPSVSHLTKFYLWMSLGGVLGGVFNALVGPLLFTRVLEYPLAIVLACVLRPGQWKGGARNRWLDVALPAAFVLALIVPTLTFDLLNASYGRVVIPLSFGIIGFLVYVFSFRPLRFGLGVGALLVAQLALSVSDVLVRERSFFGVHKVAVHDEGRFHVLVHGTTIHGAEHVDPALWREPLTYYHREGPLGQLFAALDGTDRIKRVGAVGLGAGSVVCYRKPGQTWVFYEIDPVVERLARDTRYFHFMSECAGDTPVVLGDARLSLRSAPEGYYDLMILDAFSSDAIPIHLLTREAVELYLSKLADNGILMFNISSRFLDLTTVLGNVAADLGLAGRVQIFRPLKPEDQQGFKSKSDWVVLARTPEALAMLDGRPGWKPLEPRPAAGLWTDDFSNIIGVLKWWQTAKDKAGGS